MIKKIEVLHKDNIVMIINFTNMNGIAHVNNISEKKNPWLPYISKNEKEYSISICDITKFLETRCVPRTRENIEEILKKYNLKEYSPIGICKKTHGVSHNDNYWVRFDNELLEFNNARVR